MDLFNPDFALTCLPGLFIFPLADLDMFLIFSASTTTIAWLLLKIVVSLCTKSRLTCAILRCSLRSWTSTFFQLLENFSFFANLRCNIDKREAYILKLLIGSINLPLDSAAKLVTPRSIPMAEVGKSPL